MKQIKKIGIIGVGVIGGSLGLSIKRKVKDIEVIGVSSRKTIDEALSIKAIDVGYERAEIDDCLAAADLIFLCTPISHILEILPRVAKSIKAGCLVTDVGSTKQVIVEKAASCFPKDRYFIGGHPMAGNEGHGISWADALLFENAVYILTPYQKIPNDLTNRFGRLIESIGAKLIFLTPGMHDKIAAKVSHLPQMLAVALMNFVIDTQKDKNLFLKLAAGGFRDMTRIASSSYSIWEDIIRTNSEEILKNIDLFIESLQSIKKDIRNDTLRKTFEKANSARLSIPRDTKGFLRSHFDLSVWVEDRPGIIAQIATILARENINIKDIEVLKVREGDSGTLRLSFETEKARADAQKFLKAVHIDSKFRD